MTALPNEMRIVTRRLATFQQPHQLNKRRASAQGKKTGAGTVEWPHDRPDVEALARAGFYYRPAHDSLDNVQCFLCTVKLDGWEPTDDPTQEHLAHSKGCAWATSLSVLREPEHDREPEERDPFSEELLTARIATFKTGDGWPHEDKKGWKCKIAKLAESGWAWDPSEEGEDGVTCFYCSLSLDGWEPKDDPFVEHKRRAPTCRFFELLGHYHGPEAADGKVSKVKAKGKTSTRASTTSKASRVSTQSTMSEVPSMPGSFGNSMLDTSLASADGSILTTATNASQMTATGTSKGKKKGARTKASAKGTKDRKKAQADLDSGDEMDIQYPDLSKIEVAQDSVFTSSRAPIENETTVRSSKPNRNGKRGSRQVDSSVAELSQLDVAPPKKTNRGRKPKMSQQIEPRDSPETPNAAAIASQRLSEVSAQLQDELEHSICELAPTDESTPAPEPARPKRGVKRSSDGLRKPQEIDSSVIEVEAPIAPKPQPKRAPGRLKKGRVASADAEPAFVADEQSIFDDPKGSELQRSETVVTAVSAPKKGNGRVKNKKSSSTISSRSSKASAAASEQLGALLGEPEDLERDEMEIDQELERIAAEQASQTAMATEQERVNQFEPSPSHMRISKDSAELRKPSNDLRAEVENFSEKDFGSQFRRSHQAAPPGSTPSPSGSDKENRPSVNQPSAKPALSRVVLSPSKTVRIPLAASTPNRSPAKPIHSPSKQISHLGSTFPWNAVDLDTVLLRSPQRSPGKIGEQLVAAAGSLTSPEKKMSVEDWVRSRAAQGEEELRKQCEEMVAAFEREGMRGLESLNGIQVFG